MAYTVPDAADLKAAFPAFAAVDDDVITYWITRAGRSVDESWTEGDYAHAMMLLAAHLMVGQGLGTGAAAAAAAAGASEFKRMKSGALDLERFDSADGSGSGGYASTSYGNQFLVLLRQNKGGPRVMATGAYPPPYPYPGWP